MPIHLTHALLPSGWASDVRLTEWDGLWSAVDTGIAPTAGDERHAIGVPGVANLHSHAFQRAMAGLAERRGTGADSFWSWRDTMYRFALRMSPDDVEAVAGLLYAEMLEAGFTRVGEFHYLHHDTDGRPYADRAEMAVRIAAAAAATGIGLTLLPVFYAHAGFGDMPPTDGQRRFVDTLDGYAALLAGARRAAADCPGATVGVAPHSLRAVTPAELAQVVALAEDGPIHIHVAEQVREVEECLAATGTRPVRWLLDNAPVDRTWCLIHATHMEPDETDRMARSGAVAGLCPITEANLGDGVFPWSTFAAAGGRWGVGSDSNVLVSLAEELRTLEYGLRLTGRSRNVVAPPGGSTGAALVSGALAGGVAALGGHDPGPVGLVPGASADLVTLRADHPSLAAAAGDAILDAWIFAAGNSLVDTVRVRGTLLVERGQHRARERLESRYKAALAGLAA